MPWTVPLDRRAAEVRFEVYRRTPERKRGALVSFPQRWMGCSSSPPRIDASSGGSDSDAGARPLLVCQGHVGRGPPLLQCRPLSNWGLLGMRAEMLAREDLPRTDKNKIKYRALMKKNDPVAEWVILVFEI